jgi:hypothetical protein
MSATIAMQGGHVQLEQSHMRLALNMAKMAKGGFSRAAIEETQYLFQKPPAEVREEKKQGAEFPGHKRVKAAIERHPAMLCQNHTPGYLPHQNSTPNHRQTHWRRKGTGASLPNLRTQHTPMPTPSPPRTPPALTGNTPGA